MSEEHLTFKAAADLSANIREVMRISDGDQNINVASLATETGIIGVLENKPAAAGRHATVRVSGVGQVRAGAAVSSTGVHLTCNGSGRAVAATSGQVSFGRALETAGADGDVIRYVALVPFRLSGAP